MTSHIVSLFQAATIDLFTNNEIGNVIKNKWRPGSGFDAVLRDHLFPDCQSNQYLNRISVEVKCPILAISLAKSQGPWPVKHGPNLLTHFVIRQ